MKLQTFLKKNLANINIVLISIEQINNKLTTTIFGKEVKILPETNSTNDDLWKSINKDIKEGYLIIANHQLNGRGRHGNKWKSVKGQSLTFSFLITPNFKLEKIGTLSLITSVAIVESIKKISGLNCKLKWPNDVIINGKKVGGILAESKQDYEKIYVVMGVGINVNEIEMQPDIASFATSLKLESNKEIPRELLLASILNIFESIYYNSSNWIDKWNSNCGHLNSKIKFHSDNKVINGVFKKINEKGQAIIDINGNIKKISSGTIEVI